MKSVGQLALRTLISNNPLLKRSEVLSVVDEFAFEYGLFAGHEDIRLLDDLTADIYVTYPHRSLEEFFGSFALIQDLSQGKSVDDILGSDCEKPIFMVNPLVLSFCLWFLSSAQFNFPTTGFDKLTSYVAKRIDSEVFYPDKIRSTYPAIDMLRDMSHDNSIMEFFRDVLNKCKHVRTLHIARHSRDKSKSRYWMLSLSTVLGRILGFVKRRFIDRLTKIIIGYDYFKLKETDNKSLIFSIDDDPKEALQAMNLLLQDYKLADRKPQIYLHITMLAEYDMTSLLSKYSKELHIGNDDNDLPSLKASSEFPLCPILTHLTFQAQHIEESVPSALRRAIQRRRLPRLRFITLIKCCEKSFHLDWLDEVKVFKESLREVCLKCLK